MVSAMDPYERQAMIDRLSDENARTLAEMAERRARPELEPISPAPRAPTPTMPLSPKTPPAPRPPARPGMTRRDIEIMMNATGRALGSVRAELRKELAELRAEHKHQLAALEERIGQIERTKQGPKIIDMTSLVGRGRAA